MRNAPLLSRSLSICFSLYHNYHLFQNMLSNVSLYVATSEQIIASRKRTAAAWGRGLTLEEYLDRDLVGESEEFGRDGKLITW